jgi:hypothetical protein
MQSTGSSDQPAHFTPSPDVLVAHVAGEAVLLNLGDKSYYRLNETAAFIWQALERGENRDQALASILRDFDVDETSAAAQLDQVLSDFRQKGLVS